MKMQHSCKQKNTPRPQIVRFAVYRKISRKLSTFFDTDRHSFFFYIIFATKILALWQQITHRFY